MAHDKIKKIRIVNGAVLVTSACSNVWPRDYKEQESISLSNILKEKGETAFNLVMLREYENGNFQKGTENKYSRAIDKMRRLPEYEKFNWRKADYSNDKCPVQAARKSPQFNELLLHSLSLKPYKITINA